MEENLFHIERKKLFYLLKNLQYKKHKSVSL